MHFVCAVQSVSRGSSRKKKHIEFANGVTSLQERTSSRHVHMCSSLRTPNLNSSPQPSVSLSIRYDNASIISAALDLACTDRPLQMQSRINFAPLKMLKRELHVECGPKF